ncbi:MAG: hypothetical protein R6X34_07520 [Chloroflexota bacterium]
MKIKTITLICLLVLGLLLIIGAAYAEANDYTLSWWTVDGGGGTSASSTYDLSGTIGQPDAGSMSGGGYVLAGGFWGGGRSEATGDHLVFLPMIVSD